MMSWEVLSNDEVLSVLDVKKEDGLSHSQAKKRVEAYGKNTIQVKNVDTFLAIFARQWKNPIVFLFLVMNILVIFLEQYPEAIVIGITLIANVSFGFFQEYRARKIFVLLKKNEMNKTLVVREGKKTIINQEDIVPGDIVVLKPGDKIPADVRVLESEDLHTDESVFTGEWIPVLKTAITLQQKKTLFETVNMVWRGTTIAKGTGIGVAVETGGKTKIANISNSLNMSGGMATLQKEMATIAKFVIAVVTLSGVLIFVLGLSSDIDINTLLITSIVATLAAVPTSLPAIITVVLANGSRKIMKQSGLVRSLYASETLGSVTHMIVDKTGTLTEGKMSIASIIDANGEEIVDATEKEQVAKRLLVGTDGVDVGKNTQDSRVSSSPVELAIVRFVQSLFSEDVYALRKRIRTSYIPFSSEMRLSGGVYMQDNQNILVVVGAPETIVERSNKKIVRGNITDIVESQKKHYYDFLEQKGKEGKRILAIAQQETAHSHIDSKNEKAWEVYSKGKMVFVGFLVVEDSIRDDAQETLNAIQQEGIQTILATGDNEHTASAVGKMVGICSGIDDVITGDEFDTFDDMQILEKTQARHLFARMLPRQKLRLLNILQKHGNVVSMVGDGVNDAPALHQAAIGISLKSGTPLAQQASDIILLDNRLKTIAKGIVEGRKIAENIRKVFLYTLSISLSLVALLGFAIMFGLSLPLTPGQILWNNVIEEVFLGFIFAFNFGKAYRKTPYPQKIITKNIKHFLYGLMAINGIFLIALFAYLSYYTGLEHTQIQTIVFIAASVDSIFLALSLQTLTASSVLNIGKELGKTGFLMIALTIGIVLIGFFFTPVSETLLNVVSIPPLYWLIIPIAGVVHSISITMLKKMLL